MCHKNEPSIFINICYEPYFYNTAQLEYTMGLGSDFFNLASHVFSQHDCRLKLPDTIQAGVFKAALFMLDCKTWP